MMKITNIINNTVIARSKATWQSTLRLCVIASFMFITSALFAHEQSAAEKFMQNLGDKVFETLSDTTLSHDARKEKFGELLTTNYNMKAIGKFVLGKYWKQADEKQQEEFIKYFSKSVVDTYTTRFESRTDEEFVVEGNRPEDDGGITVISFLKRPTGKDLRIDWKVFEKDGQFQIYDVLIDGISMSITLRSEYASVIQKEGGINGLIQVLAKKADSTEA